MENLQSVRIDQWLWAARFFKTRSLAQQAIRPDKKQRRQLKKIGFSR